jgi:5-methyltetrahydrofolate--homocysteine methyltransferase
MLGGAALTPKFVAQSCVPEYNQQVVYCSDAFAGLKAVREFEDGKLQSTQFSERPARKKAKTNAAAIEIARDIPVPQPPFFGTKHITDINAAEIFPFVNEQALFRGRWGYRRGKMDADKYRKLIDETVIPQYEELKRRSIEEGLVQPKVAYGYYHCYSEGNSLKVEHENKIYTFDFPRRKDPPVMCIADFFKTKAEGGDVVAFFVVTIGDKIGRISHELFDKDEYHDYLMLHAFSVEVTDALAEYWHEVMRKELGIASKTPQDMIGYAAQDYQGSRYGFGYPACPDLGAHKEVFEILKPEIIGVSLTENMEMVPEQTTSAIIAHHPQAKYFAV